MKTLTDKLERWAQIAEHIHNEKDWDECSLLHSFGDQLARDLREAVKQLSEINSMSGKKEDE